MIRLAAFVLAAASWVVAQEEAFEAAKVNKWIVTLSEDPTKDAEVGELHAYLKKFNKLTLVYSKFEESFERRPKDAKLRFLLAKLHLRDGNRTAALKWLQAATLADPEYAYTYLAQAEIYEVQEDEKGVVGALEGVIQSSKEKTAVVGAVRRLASYYGKRQDGSRAASLWASLGERYPEDAALLGEAIQGIVDAGNLPRAAECLRAALAAATHAPADRARFFLELATLERRTGRLSDATKTLAEAAKAAIDDPVLGRKVDESILAWHREEDRLKDLSEKYERDLSLNRTNAVYIWRLARLRMVQGRLPEAREILTAGIDRNPGHMLLLTALADVAALQLKWAEVRELAVQFLMREPQVRDHRKREGMACLELGKYPEAEVCFRAYATTAAESVEIARLYDKRARTADAAAWYRRALDQKYEAEWSRALVGLLVRLDRIADAEQEAVRCTPGDRERWALMRDLLIQKNDIAKASLYAKKDVEANPKDFAAVFGLGKLLTRLSSEEAEAALRAALALAKKTERSAVYEELAGMAAGLKPTQHALLRNEILALLKEDPTDGGLYYALYRLQPGNVDLLEEGRRNDPRHVRLRQELAPFYLKQKQYDLAIDVYRELIEIDAARRDHYVYAIGEVYWALGHKEEAFSWWAKVQGSAKDKVGITFQLAKKFEAENRFTQAIELMLSILKAEPDGVLYHWTLAQLYRQVGNFEGLMSEYKWILANSKDEGYLRTARQVISEKLSEHAKAYAEEGSWTRALEEFTEALRYAANEPATASLLGHIARCCEHLRDYVKAAEAYHQILSRFPGYVVTASQGRTMNAVLFATLQLRGNPESLKAYEDLVGGQAKELFVQASQRNDRAGVERILTLFPLSRAAGEAAWWLAESYRKEGQVVKAAGILERLLAEFPLAGLDEMLVRLRTVELAAQLKDWGTVSTQLGEMVARGKDKTVTVENRTVAVKDFVAKWQKELAAHGAGSGATWGLIGRDGRGSSSTVQEVSPPLAQKWRYQAVQQNNVSLTLPPIYAAGGLVYLAKEDSLVALDGSSGSVRWTAPLRVQRTRVRANGTTQSYHPNIEGRLAVSQGVVAGIESDTEIRVYDASTGAPIWTKTTDVPRSDGGPTGLPRMRIRGGLASQLEHMEIVTATRQCFIVREGDKLRAYSLRTGRVDWQTDVPNGSLPIAIDTGGMSGNAPVKLDRQVLESEGVLIHVYGDTIRAMDTLSGRDLWEVKLPTKPLQGPNPWSTYYTLLPDGFARAVIGGDQLFTLTGLEGKLAAYELRTGKLRWELPAEALVTESQLAADDQNLYALVNKSLTVLSLRTGVRQWRREAKNYVPPQRGGMPPPTIVQSRMSIAGSRIFLSSSEEQSGEAARLEVLDRKTGSTVWEHGWDAIGRMMGDIRGIGVDLWGRPIPSQASAPVICDGWLYVMRSDGVLYAFHGKAQELAALRDAIRRDPESAQAHFQLGDLHGSEGQTGLEIEEYRTALKLALKKAETAAMRELIAELKSRLFVRYMKQGETTTDFEAALKAFLEARAFADGEASLARVMVRTAAVLLATGREVDAVDVLSSILNLCPSALSPIEGAIETAGDYAKRQLGKLGPGAKQKWEKAHAEDMEKAFAPGKSVEELEKAIEKYSFSSKADQARIRAARVHFDQKRYKETVLTLDRIRPEFLDQADADTYFEAWDLLASALLQTGDDRRALGIYQKMLTESAKDAARLASVRERAEKRHKELKESWERNGVFGSPLRKIWESPAPLSKPVGPTLEAFRPTIDRGRLYVLDLQGQVQAIDTATLQPIWSAGTEDFSYFFQITSNSLTALPMDPLLVVSNTILVVGGKTLRAFDPIAGGPLWSVQSPAADGVVHQIVVDGNRVYTCETKGRVCARDEKTGRLLWSVRPGSSATGVMSDRSGASGGGLFYSRIGVEGNRLVVQPAGDPGTLFGYDVASGKQVWKSQIATYTGYLKGRVQLEVAHGMVVLGDFTGSLSCLDLADGKQRWKITLASPVEGVLPLAEKIVVATPEQVLLVNARTGKRDWIAAPDLNGQFSRDKDMRVGATSMAAKGKWLVVGSANAVSILDLATGQVKDQVKSDAAAPVMKVGARFFPLGRSFASVALGPEGIFWGVASDAGSKWTLLR